MGERMNRHIVLARKPEGKAAASDFEMRSAPLADPAPGEVQLANRVVSLDPYIGLKIGGRHMSGAINAGDTVTGEAICEVIASTVPQFQSGQTVRADIGWQEYANVDAARVHAVNPAIDPPSLALGALGMPGLTGYAGLMRIGRPVAGETVLVSAATGGVGSMVGQLARVHGCRTIGLVGSDEKVRWAVEEGGYDVCLNYRHDDCEARLKEAAPDGVHIYYDNVGGALLQMAMNNLGRGGRVVLCGLMGSYDGKPVAHTVNVAQLFLPRARIEPVIVYDHEDLRGEMEEKCMAWIGSGDMRFKEDRTAGLENAPAAFERLMRGENFGKVVVDIAS